MIGGATKVVGLIGDPIEHSLSPRMHNAAFRYMNLDYVYVPFRVREKDLKNAVNGALALNLKGFNVTIPHKVSIIKYLNRIDSTARKIGAVNTVIKKDGELFGYNTDGLGALEALRQEGIDLKDRKILIIGAGGASRAISYTLASLCSKLIILNRTGAKAIKLAKEFKNIGCRVYGNDLNLKLLKEELSDSDILINTTSVGMHPYTEESPVPKEYLHKDLVVFDIVYNPLETLLLKYAKGVGAKTIDGVGMLVNQGAISFKMWTGFEAPKDIMRKVVVENLSGRD